MLRQNQNKGRTRMEESGASSPDEVDLEDSYEVYDSM
jgi:hypothetical protein